MTDSYKVLGGGASRRAFVEAHCERLHQWHDRDGRFIGPGAGLKSRELLWNAVSLLECGRDSDLALGNAIVEMTPIDNNGFQPIYAVELILRFGDRLREKAVAHLKTMAREHLPNVIDVRFGNGGLNNFSCMATFFLLAVSRILDHYRPQHRFANIPEVYTAGRLWAMGMNALQSLAWLSEHHSLPNEYNSPCYSPISLHALACIVELIDDEQARRLSRNIEMKLWRGVLKTYHPKLRLLCGPYSRAYRGGILGLVSNMRELMRAVEIEDGTDMEHLKILDGPEGNVPYNWSQTNVACGGRFHVPTDALEELRNRQFPSRFEAPVHWESYGWINPDTQKYVPLQGGLLPAGQATLVQRQGRDWALGFVSRTGHITHGFPIQFHYALKQPPQTMREVRTITAGVMFYGLPDAPREWMTTPEGKKIEPSNFNHAGRVEVCEKDNELSFTACPFKELAGVPTAECSLNSFIPTHFHPVGRIRLNNQPFDGDRLQLRAASAVLRVEDADFVYEIQYRFAQPRDVRLFRWTKFIRFAVYFHEGPARAFTAAELERFSATGAFRLLKTPKAT